MECLADIRAKITNLVSITEVSIHASGTDALYEIVRSLELKNTDSVLVPVFACERLLLPFLKLKIPTIIVDTERQGVTSGLKEFQAAYKPSVKVLLLVYPWGYIPTDVFEVVAWARDKKIIIIEDIASAVGLSYQHKKLGTIGDFSFGSFGHDKFCAVGQIGFSNLKAKDSLVISENEKMFYTMPYNSLIKLIRKRCFGFVRPFILVILANLTKFSFRMPVPVSKVKQLAKNLEQYQRELNVRAVATQYYGLVLKNISGVRVLLPNNDQAVATRVVCLLNTSTKRNKVFKKATKANIWLGRDYVVPLNRWLYWKLRSTVRVTYVQNRIVNLITNPAHLNSQKVVEMIESVYQEK